MELLHSPKVTGSFAIDIENEAPVTTYFQFTEDELPEEFMSQLAQVRGDGTNRVAMTTDFGIKEFGTGVSGSCTLSISTGSTDDALSAAVALASRWSIYFAKQHFEMAEAELRSMLAARGKQLT